MHSLSFSEYNVESETNKSKYNACNGEQVIDDGQW